MYIATKKVWMTHTHTHTNPEMHIRQTVCPVQTLYLHVHLYMSVSSANIHFVYNSCLFVACNLAVGGKVKVK